MSQESSESGVTIWSVTLMLSIMLLEVSLHPFIMFIVQTSLMWSSRWCRMFIVKVTALLAKLKSYGQTLQPISAQRQWRRQQLSLLVWPGNTYQSGRLGTVDPLALTSLDQLISIQKIFTVCTEQAILTRRSTVLCLPLQLAFPGLTPGFPLFQTY